jgi:hypothetical protein
MCCRTDSYEFGISASWPIDGAPSGSRSADSSSPANNQRRHRRLVSLTGTGRRQRLPALLGQPVDKDGQPSPEELVYSRPLRLLLCRALKHADPMAESQLLQLQCGSGFQQRRQGNHQAWHNAKSRTKKLMDDSQPSSYQAVRDLREGQVLGCSQNGIRGTVGRHEAELLQLSVDLGIAPKRK